MNPSLTDLLLNEPPIVEGDIPHHLLPSSKFGLFFSMSSFDAELNEYEEMDVMTFSCFEPQWGGGPVVRRLIFCRETKYIFQRVRKFKRAANVHAKLFICYPGPQAYFGSANWSPRGDFVELMARATKKQTKELVKYYNKLWNYLCKK